MINKYIMNYLKYKIQHYNPKKYWKYRKIVTASKKSKIIKMFYLMKLKKMDAFNNASLGTNLEKSAIFLDEPCFPHGLNGVIISQFAKVGRASVIYHQVTIGSKDNETAPTIGDNVTIYPGAKIIGNITIGNNVIIGANAVVTKSFPDNCIVGGVPAKVIKKIS